MVVDYERNHARVPFRFNGCFFGNSFCCEGLRPEPHARESYERCSDNDEWERDAQEVDSDEGCCRHEEVSASLKCSATDFQYRFNYDRDNDWLKAREHSGDCRQVAVCRVDV